MPTRSFGNLNDNGRRTTLELGAIRVLTVCVLASILGPALTFAQSRPIKPAATEVPAGEYTLDRAHASLIFRVSHLDLSRYTARFTRFDAKLHLDPADPAASRVTATVDPRSLVTHFPHPTPDFDALLQGAQWLAAARFPKITFRSTRIVLTSPNTASITGDLSLHGVTRPVTLEATFNGGYAGHPLDPAGSRIGFSAKGTLKRSQFGIDFGLPPKGSRMGVGDDVEFVLEVEFTRPKPASGQDK